MFQFVRFKHLKPRNFKRNVNVQNNAYLLKELGFCCITNLVTCLNNLFWKIFVLDQIKYKYIFICCLFPVLGHLCSFSQPESELFRNCQSVSQSKSVGQSVSQSVSQTVVQSVKQSVSQSVSQTVSRSVWQSFSQSVLVLSPSGIHDQILGVVKKLQLYLSWGVVLPDERTGLSCNRSHSLSVLVRYTCVLFPLLLLLLRRPAGQVLYSTLCLLLIYCPRI
jgi:hypothetical protein